MRSKGPWVVALLAVAGAAAWAWTRSTPDPTVAGGAALDGGARAADAPGAVPGRADAPTLAARGGPPARADGDLAPRGDPRGRASIVGTVRRRGAPAAARVEARLSLSADPERAMRSGPAAFLARVVAPPLALERPAAVAAAGDDGRFAIEGLAAGVWQLRAVAPDGAVGAADVELVVDGARAVADVELGAGSEALEGRVKRTDGTPFRGLVTVVRAPGARQGLGALVASGELLPLDDEGRFRATGLESGAYVVSAIELGVFRAVGRPVLVPTTAPYVMTVGPSATPVAGRVVAEPEGLPVVGADVLAGGRGDEALDLVVARTTTGADGAFVLAIGGGDDRAVVVAAVGYAPVFVPVATARTEPLEIRLTRAASVRGRVTAEADGTPVGGLDVSAASAGRGLPFASAPSVTDADGRYRIDDVPPGDAWVTAAGRGWITKGAGDASRAYDPRMVPVAPGETTTVDLVVMQGARLAGVVLAPDGAPAPGAVVRAAPVAADPGRDGGGAGRAVTASASDGLFLLEGLLPDTPYDVLVTAPGAGEARVGPTVATTTMPPPRVEVRLVAPVALDVTVVDAEQGTPVVGASVRVSVPDRAGDSSRGATTDGQGHARIERAPGAVASVRASHDDYLGAGDTKVADGEPRVVVRLRRALLISGTVVHPDGTPAVAARVASEAQGRWVRPTVTDASGRFRLTRLEPGTYDLEARLLRAERVPLVAKASVAAGTADLVLTLARPDGQATGLVVKVLGPDGQPVPSAYVEVDLGDGASSGSSVENGLAIVDLSGRAAGLAGATVRVPWARTRAGAPLPFGPGRLGPLTGRETEVEVRLPVEATVAGIVRDPDGAPVSGVVVLAASPAQTHDLEGAFEGDGGVVPRARTDAEGRFRVGGLADGAEVEVYVAPPPDFPRPEPVRARGGQQDVVVTLAPGTAVVLTVLDEAGAPVPGATVNTTVVDDRRADDPWRSPQSGPAGRADATGAVRLRGFDLRKRYALAVDGPAEDWLTSRREAWSPRDETIRLTRGLKVAGVVRDPAGRPLAGVEIYRRLSEGSWSGGPTTDAAGRFEFDRLPAGDVVLLVAVGASGAVPGPGAVEVRTRAGAADVEITLDPGLEIVLRLADGNGDPQASLAHLVTVGADGKARAVTHVRFDADGVARARGLASRDRFLVWWAPDGQGRVFLARDVRPGTEVAVVPRPGLAIRVRVRAPAGATNLTVTAHLEDLWVSVPGVQAPDGTFEILGLPEGSAWRLEGACQVDGRWLATQGPVVAAGGTADLEMKGGGR